MNLNTYTAQNFKLPPLMRGSRFGGRGSRSGPPPPGIFINLRTVKLPKIGFRPPSHLCQTLISLGPPPPPKYFPGSAHGSYFNKLQFYIIINIL